jgi:hypothetical protein
MAVILSPRFLQRSARWISLVGVPCKLAVGGRLRNGPGRAVTIKKIYPGDRIGLLGFAELNYRFRIESRI